MSASNIRRGKAYDNDDIAAVSRLLRRPLPNETDTPEFTAMSRLDHALSQFMPADRAEALADDDVLAGMIWPQVELDEATAARVFAWARSKYSTKTA